MSDPRIPRFRVIPPPPPRPPQSSDYGDYPRYDFARSGVWSLIVTALTAVGAVYLFGCR